MVVFWTLVTSLLKRPDINSIKYWLQTRLGISKDQDQLTVKTDKLLRSADLLNRVDPIGISQVQGFLGYDFWDGGDCNGNKTFVQGMQTDFCTLHSSGNGSFKIQISDGQFSLYSSLYSHLLPLAHLLFSTFISQLHDCRSCFLFRLVLCEVCWLSRSGGPAGVPCLPS